MTNKLQFKPLSKSDYEAKIKEACVLSADRYGDKVLRLSDGNILKLFRVKRLISKAQFFPYAVRFAENTAKLHKLQIKTVETLHLWRIPHLKRTAIEYQPLLGTNLRDFIKNENKLPVDMIVMLAKFIAKLHDKGIYFRSLHLGNILFLTSLQFGIIDCADMVVKKRSLSVALRLRNFKHLMRYQQDLNHLLKPNPTLFIESYLINLPKKSQDRLKSKLIALQQNYQNPQTVKSASY